MIHTDNLTFQYGKKEHSFRFPDIALTKQEHLLILGKSGIGKTTLLHLLAGILQPTNGTITIDSVAINELTNKQLDKFRGETIGLVFQKKHAIASLSVLENVQARLFFSKKNVPNNAIEGVLKELGLYDFKHHKISELSEGQLQRLGIACAVIHEPKILLADEPTSSLDDENCRLVMELLLKQAQSTNANLIVITHDFRIKSFFQNFITL